MTEKSDFFDIGLLEYTEYRDHDAHCQQKLCFPSPSSPVVVLLYLPLNYVMWCWYFLGQRTPSHCWSNWPHSRLNGTFGYHGKSS